MQYHGFTKGQVLSERPLKLRFYHRFQTLSQRCKNPRSSNFRNYGARGISCKWSSFEEFKRDMWLPFKAHAAKHGVHNTTLERVSNDGDYCKENCRWATMREQRRNSRQNKFLLHGGKRKPLVQIAEETGISYRLLVKRIAAGWTLERALRAPSLKKPITFNGKSQGITAWARELGMKQATLSQRLLNYGWSVEEAFTTPILRRKNS